MNDYIFSHSGSYHNDVPLSYRFVRLVNLPGWHKMRRYRRLGSRQIKFRFACSVLGGEIGNFGVRG